MRIILESEGPAKTPQKVHSESSEVAKSVISSPKVDMPVESTSVPMYEETQMEASVVLLSQDVVQIDMGDDNLEYASITPAWRQRWAGIRRLRKQEDYKTIDFISAVHIS